MDDYGLHAPEQEDFDVAYDIGELLKKGGRIHFVGIGGSGMFPIVQILHSLGHEISGSDVSEGSIVGYERAMGIDVCIGHKAENVDGASMLVVTAALFADNPEVARANELGIPVIPRADMFGYITTLYDNAMCVSGTHGKTTTTCMLTSILLKAGEDPSALIGGKLPLIDGYGRVGKSSNFVCEACEFKDTFLQLSPSYSIILNIDDDHLDYFGTIENSMKSFRRFADNASRAVVANCDDENTVKALSGFTGNIVWFGEGEDADYRITDAEAYDRAFFRFRISHHGEDLGEFRLKVPGRQNVFNAAAAIAASCEIGISADSCREGLESFRGAGRRFEILGEFKGATVADDYGHHPTELSVTLDAALAMGYDRVIAVFQPFTFSRTKLLLDDFAKALSKADVVVMTAIMGSREINTYGISTQDLADLIPGSVWFETFEEVRDHILSIARPGDLVLTMGCGDVYKCAHMILDKGNE
ncbi:MAG: UDP-N-acetylmuramate--L-alanine ligase [Oscillospiraceae bacterium]|jgi:UDP-N-acetylmuramate--alanine ligase|nr:UDP-N-acetylmuramate--L-alanine ligase [Oscillospiraceae bacterium]